MATIHAPTPRGASEAAPDWLSDPYPGRLRTPTMLTPAEIDYLHYLAHTWAVGRGRFVELGCFLGGSTAALATGLRDNPRARGHLLTYDSFVMDAYGARLCSHPYEDGDDFLPLFELYLRDLASLVDVRAGWIPEDASVDQRRGLYPEDEAVEILFVDAAKTRGVHTTILQTFAGHLIPGHSILVQQDFKHFHCHWIPVHMHQLRSCFEPVHDVPHSATLSFRCLADPTDHMDDLLKTEGMSVGDTVALWDEIEQCWAKDVSAHSLCTLALNRVTHLSSLGALPEAVAALDRIIAGAGPVWTQGLGAIGAAEIRGAAAHIKEKARSQNDDAMIAEAARLDRAVPPASSKNSISRAESALWKQVAKRCEDADLRRVALYGAGRHTQRLLDSGWPETPLSVVAILDDRPILSDIKGVPVMRPQELTEPVQAVILSSDAHEKVLAEAAERSLAGLNVPVIRMYS